MLCSIDKVTTEYQQPWIVGNCMVYRYSYAHPHRPKR